VAAPKTRNRTRAGLPIPPSACTLEPHPLTLAMRKTKSLTQLYGMQAVLNVAVLDPTTPTKEKAQCALAWERLEERKRILRGRPLPGSLRPKPETKRAHRKPQPVTPLFERERPEPAPSHQETGTGS